MCFPKGTGSLIIMLNCNVAPSPALSANVRKGNFGRECVKKAISLA